MDVNGILDEEETRVAICGETFDASLRNSQHPNTNPVSGWDLIVTNNQANNPLDQYGLPNGFIAVFDGAGLLLWSYHFYFEGYEGHSSVTDLSIRVETTDGVKHDVVTYCGMSTFGIPTMQVSPDHTLSPISPFRAPTSTVSGYVPADGATDNGAGPTGRIFQWDGFVGRLVNDHNNPNPLATVRKFHSVVGGSEQDALFGLTEIDANRFVVVGGTAVANLPNWPVPLGGPIAPRFPFTATSTNWNNLTLDYCVGVAMVFDASDAAELQLKKSVPLGSTGILRTHARDVVHAWEDGGHDRLYIVGATDDPSFFGTLPTTVPGGPIVTGSFTGTGVNGFLAMAADDPATLDLDFRSGAFQNNLGTCGVAKWNEHSDHVTVLGGQGDLHLASCFRDTAAVPGGDQLLVLREGVVASTGTEYPSMVGKDNAATYSGQFPPPPPYPNGSQRGWPYVQVNGGNDLGVIPYGYAMPQNGGGIAVDERGRINIVGSSRDGGFPVEPSSPTRARGNVVFATTAYENAVRSVVDMIQYGKCGRTDGTGSPPQANLYPLAGMDGGTTPVCGRSPFGRRVSEPLPGLPRMNIDVEGSIQAGNVIAILCDRPPATGTAGIAALQIGYPNTTPPVTLPSGMEIYTTNSPVWYPVAWTPGQSLRYPLSTLPPSPFTFTAQLVFGLSASIPGGVPPVCATTAIEAASPALWIAY
jgi:hypothetical protein